MHTSQPTSITGYDMIFDELGRLHKNVPLQAKPLYEVLDKNTTAKDNDRHNLKVALSMAEQANPQAST